MFKWKQFQILTYLLGETQVIEESFKNLENDRLIDNLKFSEFLGFEMKKRKEEKKNL